MTDTATLSARNVSHGAFTIERSFPNVTPQRVFEAFASEKGKDGWFSGPDERWEIVAREFDFRVGGRERLKGRWTTGLVTDFQATYWDIVPGERIIYVYSMHLDERLISVSLATFEFKRDGAGTRFVMHEDGAFLDGFDDNGGREQGSREIVDKLARYLEA